MEIKYKQYVVVPRKPKMSKGKIASQVAHATFMALEKQKQFIKPTKEISDLIQNWKFNGMCVIVLECKDINQLMAIDKYMEQWDIPHYMYVDEGIYGCEPFTPTALATGVLEENQAWFLSKMKLFK